MNGKFPIFLLSLWFVLILVCCVSKTFHDQRFDESMQMSAPTMTVTLPDQTHFSFAVVGDLHIGMADTSRVTRILNAAQAEGDSFIVLLGDLADTGAEADVTALRKAITDAGFDGKVITALGNHDIFSDGWTYFKKQHGPGTYSVTIGNSKFIVLDTADGTVGEKQRDWFSDQLKSSASTNNFVAGHYAPITPNKQTYLRLSDQVESLRLMKLMKEGNVRAYLGAHYHSYLLGTISGVQYLIAGGGGGRRMEPVMDYFFVQATVANDQVSFLRQKVD